MTADLYFIQTGRDPWRTVSQAEFIAAERAAGFHPRGTSPVATAGFSAGLVEGMVVHPEFFDPAAHHWATKPELRDAIIKAIEENGNCE